jgi:hypothetical protein
VSRLGRLLGVFIVVASSTQCQLLTDSVNRMPSVELRVTTMEIVLRQQVEFMATAQDPDEDARNLKLQWFAHDRGDCPTNLAEARAVTDPQQGDKASFTMTPVKMGAFCVWVIVTDSQGARAFAGKRFEVVNGLPVAVVELVGQAMATTIPERTRLPLFSDLKVSGAKSNDREDKGTLIYEWKWQTPAGTPTPAACDPTVSPPSDQLKCWRLERPGDYQLELRVRDTLMAWSKPAMMQLTVQPDDLPCIERTEPPFGLTSIVADPTQPLSFRLLSVTDDGDPYPTLDGGPPTGEVVWWRKLPGDEGFQRLTSTSMTTLIFPGGRFRSGDVVEVRLDYRDRQPEHDPLRCGTDAPTCPDKGDCRQRVEWKVSLL